MIGVASGTHYADQIRSPLTTYVNKSASMVVRYKKPAPLPDKRSKRTTREGVLVDLAGPVGEYQHTLPVVEARDLTIATHLLDRIEASKSASAHFAPEKSDYMTLTKLIKKAGLDRELTRLEAHKVLMEQEGLSPLDIEALTSDEKARLLRKYASEKANKFSEAFERDRDTKLSNAIGASVGTAMSSAQRNSVGPRSLGGGAAAGPPLAARSNSAEPRSAALTALAAAAAAAVAATGGAGGSAVAAPPAPESTYGVSRIPLPHGRHTKEIVVATGAANAAYNATIQAAIPSLAAGGTPSRRGGATRVPRSDTD